MAVDGLVSKYSQLEMRPNQQGKLMCGVYKPTNVISVSYGGGEQFVPIAYQRRQCLEFMKLGLQGVSIIFSSGDAGVGGKAFPMLAWQNQVS